MLALLVPMLLQQVWNWVALALASKVVATSCSTPPLPHPSRSEEILIFFGQKMPPPPPPPLWRLPIPRLHLRFFVYFLKVVNVQRRNIWKVFWYGFLKASEAGVHRPHVSGIHGRDNEGAFSIVLAGGYEDDLVRWLHCSFALLYDFELSTLLKKKI